MATIETKRIRNVALLGHSGCGKTSLAEAMLFISGGTDRLGKIADGNTVCDYDSEEIARKFSLSGAVAPLVWKDIKVNVLDTPGYLDFAGEVAQALRVADSALIVIDAKSGIQVGTELAWDAATEAVCLSPSSSTSSTITKQDSLRFLTLCTTSGVRRSVL